MSPRRSTCSVCGAPLRRELITYTQTVDEAVCIVLDVPAYVCPRDGEQYLAADTVDALDDIIRQGELAERTIEVPVYRYSRAVA